jgi:hypothetical protein
VGWLRVALYPQITPIAQINGLQNLCNRPHLRIEIGFSAASVVRTTEFVVRVSSAPQTAIALVRLDHSLASWKDRRPQPRRSALPCSTQEPRTWESMTALRRYDWNDSFVLAMDRWA